MDLRLCQREDVASSGGLLPGIDFASAFVAFRGRVGERLRSAREIETAQNAGRRYSNRLINEVLLMDSKDFHF